MRTLRLNLLILAVSAIGFSASAAPPAAKPAPLGLDQLRAQRQTLAHRPRRVIFNNDGCDCLYFPREKAVTADHFLKERTTDLAGSQVDSIFYCTISSGFSFFTHRTRVGTVLTRAPADYGLGAERRNISDDLIRQGCDCLQAVIGFARRQRMEAFWSMRMNDTHDAEHRPDKPYFLFPPLKEKHPDWLVGEPVKRTPYGRWSSVDYGRAEIRDLAFRYIEEVCQNYDVDGVELDFFRHLCYFKRVALGGKATAQECDLMTELLRRVRQMSETVGCQRGRPILIAVRVPDSQGFNRDMGLDVERWLREGLVDILITTCYFRLNPWEYSVALAKKHNVAFYAGLSESRVLGESRFHRQSLESYRARATNAWQAGTEGIYLFNYFDPRGPLFRELGDAQQLRRKDKLYFATNRDGDPERYLANGRTYQTVPILTPSRPAVITFGKPLKISLTVGEDLAGPAATLPKVQLHCETPSLGSAERLVAKLNGQTLGGGQVVAGWVDYPVPPACLQRGQNQVELALAPRPAAADDGWSFEYRGDRKPGKPWRRDAGSSRTEERLADGKLLIADRGTESGDYLYYRYPWGADPVGQTVVEARVKVVSGSSYVIVTNGVAHERVGLWPDRIELWDNKRVQYKMNTTDQFHLYRIVCKGRDLAVFVDGQLRLDGKGLFGPERVAPHNELAFGAANSGMVGEAYWEFVRARVDSQPCSDLVLSVKYAKTR
jgi:hypothetical protein